MYDTLESMYVNQKKIIDTSIKKNHRYVNQKKHLYVNQKKIIDTSIRTKSSIHQSEKNHRYVNQKNKH